MGYLILARHGEPAFGPEDRLAGWMDIPLSRKGIDEALECASKLVNIDLDLAFASNLVRTQETVFIILSGQEKKGAIIHEKTNSKCEIEKVGWYYYPKKLSNEIIPVCYTAALNERYYGKLQGKKKQKMIEKYGEENVSSWRWNFEPGPPKGESLKNVYERAVPYFKKKILPAVNDGKNVLVCAHQSSLRAMIKYIEDISDKNIRNFRFSTGELVIYRLSEGRLVREDTVKDQEINEKL
jgi:2,3-bisphosphoglycerate-dependent phosphoglycerate mutase